MERPSVAYGALLLLHAKILWGIWWWRDLTSGDTASYFIDAHRWAESLKGNIAWSPLYTAFYGAVFRVFPDAHVATLVHRIVIVLATSVLVLAVMRAFLPAAVAWLVAVWWAILPIRFDALYEVHLFALIPVLVAVLLVARRPTTGGRAAAVAVLAASAVLVRNEFTATALVVGVAFLGLEWRQGRRDGTSRLKAVARPYGVAAAVVLIVVAAFYARSPVQGEHLRTALDGKHAQNVCQIYAFNYQQRHPEWTQSPWTECGALVLLEFGVPDPSFTEALRRNPGAMRRYLAWNVHLVPAGIQLSLFNSASGRDNPDYVPAPLPRRRALAFSALLAAVVIAGTVLAGRDRSRLWKTWVRDQGSPLIVLGASSLVTGGVMLMQRPRPSYLFSLTVSLMLVAALAATVVARRAGLLRYLPAAAAACGLAIAVALPPHYRDGPDPRPLRDAYYRLRPFASELRAPNAVLATTTYNFEICSYVAQRTTVCPSLPWSDIEDAAERPGSFGRALNESGATVLYADQRMLSSPVAQPFFSSPGTDGWRLVASGEKGGRRWQVLLRTDAAVSPPSPHAGPQAAAVPPAAGLRRVTA